MAMVDMRDMLYHAYQNRYAVGAFEVVNLDFVQAIIQAAEESRSPVILNVVEQHNESNKTDLLLAATEKAAKTASVPVAIQYDHCASVKSVKNGISLGCNGVMYDASNASFPVNVDQTKKIVSLAHSCGIPVEGALGHVCEVNKSKGGSVEPILTPIQEAEAYVERTGVDFLAISIGTVHGRATGRCKLDFNRLVRINSAMKIPLVIHGGTGLSDSQYHKLIDNGVAKINYFTALSETVLETVSGNVSNQKVNLQKLFHNVRNNLAAEVKRCMQVWRSAGRAAEVLIQCRAWNQVDHLLVCQTEHKESSLIQQVLMTGKNEISEFPGVTAVQIGRMQKEESAYQYCWLIRFASEEALSTFKKESVHSSINKYVKPASLDKVDISFNILNHLDQHQTMSVSNYA